MIWTKYSIVLSFSLLGFLGQLTKFYHEEPRVTWQSRGPPLSWFWSTKQIEVLKQKPKLATPTDYVNEIASKDKNNINVERLRLPQPSVHSF